MNKKRIFNSISLIALLLLSPFAFAKAVGTVTFTTGEATINRADNTSIKATKNAELNAGDAIETKNGRLQLSLIDGGKVSLQPNTVYKINKYEFSGKEDGSEFAFTELLKGGMRTVSGLIGHKNRERYQLKTAVATIGIRGTEFTVNFNNNQLLMTTNQGSVDVCNAGGCLNALAGQSIAVAGIGAAPKPSSKPAKAAAAAAPSSAKTVFAVADAIDNTGAPLVVANAFKQTIDNQVAEIISTVTGSAPVQLGAPTVAPTIAALNINNVTGTYAVQSSTVPVLTTGLTIVSAGAANTVTGNFNVNFANYKLGYNLAIPIAGNFIDITGANVSINKGIFIDNQATISGSYVSQLPVTGTGALANGASVRGALFGSNAQNIGFQYGANLIGAGALGQTLTLSGFGSAVKQ